MHAAPPILELSRVTRSFPGVTALDDVSFELRPGEVHALVGENGAGKSTLLNLISGVLTPDAGQIRLDGQPIQLADPVTARRFGIVAVHQEAELFESLSLAENLALMVGLPTRQWRVDWRRVYAEARAAVGPTGDPFDIGELAGRLSVAHRHMAQVAAAVARQARVLVLDEPTSALSSAESNWLFEQIARLKRAGVGILYISHRQNEIFALADRVTVLRDGRQVWSGPIGDTSREKLVEAMVGRASPLPVAANSSLLAPEPPTARKDFGENGSAQPNGLTVRQLTDAQRRFRNVSLDVRSGEILSIYGLVGSGRSEFAQALVGLRPGATGEVQVAGQTLRLGSADAAARAHVAYVPEDRLRQGLCRGLSVRANLLLASLRSLAIGPFLSRRLERTVARRQADSLQVSRRSLEQPVGQLSGGNQQKVVLGRWLLTEPQVLILDEPTRGVDVGAKAELHRIIRQRADQGSAVILISSELPEVLENSDRVLVFREGQIAGEFQPSTPAEKVGHAALPDSSSTRDLTAGVSPWRARFSFRAEWGLATIITALAITLSLTSPAFASWESLVNLLTGASVSTILALGAAMVIITGGIDISVGSLLALSAAACGLVLKLPYSPAITIPLGIGSALAVGVAGGLANGGLTLLGRVHPIVITLGTMTIFRGLLLALTGGDAITDLPNAFDQLAHGRLIGLEGAIWILAATTLTAHFWLGHTRWGRYQYAIGSSQTAARLVGIPARRVTLIAFAGGGLLAGLAGLVELAKSGSMQSGLGTGYELQAIAAAVIGGTSINGGRGSAVGTVMGALLLSLLATALVFWQVSRNHVDLVIGSLILVAIIFDRGWQRLDS